MEAALPNLKDFRFDYDKSIRYGLDHRDGCGARMHPQRYMYFDESHCNDANDRGELDVQFVEEDSVQNVHKETLEADQESLDRLLKTVKSRR